MNKRGREKFDGTVKVKIKSKLPLLANNRYNPMRELSGIIAKNAIYVIYSNDINRRSRLRESRRRALMGRYLHAAGRTREFSSRDNHVCVCRSARC